MELLCLICNNSTNEHIFKYIKHESIQHEYPVHKSCIYTWIDIQRLNSSGGACPICRWPSDEPVINWPRDRTNLRLNDEGLLHETLLIKHESMVIRSKRNKQLRPRSPDTRYPNRIKSPIIDNLQLIILCLLIIISYNCYHGYVVTYIS